MGMVKKWKDMNLQRGTRFRLNPFDMDAWREGRKRDTLMNKLMEEIPGVNNYPGYLEDDAFGVKAVQVRNASRPINAAYYHNWYAIYKIFEFETRSFSIGSNSE